MISKRNSIGKRIKSCIIPMVLILSFMQMCIPVWAEELGPLIQTTSFQSDFEGMVHLDLFQTMQLSEIDCNKASKNIIGTFLRVDVSGHYGSGNIWDITEDEIVIVTNQHVLQYWNKDSFVTFMDGRVASGSVLFISEEADLGFVSIPLREFEYEELLQMRSVRKSEKIYHSLEKGSVFFAMSVAQDIYYPVMHEGIIENTDYYIREFNAHMLYGISYGKPGMSGGGMFDGFGNYIGMTTGGTVENELAGVPVTVMLEEYKKAIRNHK